MNSAKFSLLLAFASMLSAAGGWYYGKASSSKALSGSFNDESPHPVPRCTFVTTPIPVTTIESEDGSVGHIDTDTEYRTNQMAAFVGDALKNTTHLKEEEVEAKRIAEKYFRSILNVPDDEFRLMLQNVFYNQECISAADYRTLVNLQIANSTRMESQE